jgi:hypothetical protein
MVAVPITIFDSDTIPRDRRAELEGRWLPTAGISKSSSRVG